MLCLRLVFLFVFVEGSGGSNSTHQPPWNWFLVPGVFKLLHPFHSFFVSSFCVSAFSPTFHSWYLCFQLLSCSWFLSNRPFSCVCLHHSSSFFYIPPLSLSLCGHLQTQLVWSLLRPLSEEDGILGAEVPYRLWSVESNVLLFFLAWTSPSWVVGLANPINQLVMFCPNFD